MAKSGNQQKHLLYFREIPEVQKNWKWFFILGIILILAGLAAIFFSGWTTLFTVTFLGALLVVAGGVQIINSFRGARWAGVSLGILLGILYVVIGAICIVKPIVGAEAFTAMIAIFFWIGGIFRLISALTFRFDHWGLIAFNGLVAIFLGVMIFLEWPYSVLWVIGFFVGIDMLLLGWMWVFLSLAAKKTAQLK